MSRARFTRWLAAAPPALFATYAVAVAFTTYFCMYAFRKPFAAGHYDSILTGSIDLKTALIIGQLVGYALSKMLGVKFNSELTPGRRFGCWPR